MPDPNSGSFPSKTRARHEVYERRYREEHREEIRERQREQREANPQAKREYDQRYRAANKDKIRAYNQANRERDAARQKARQLANRDQILPAKREAGRAYYARIKKDAERIDQLRVAARARRRANPDRVRANVRYRKHGLTAEALGALWRAQDGRCYLCQRPLEPAEAVIDHDHQCCPPGKSCALCRRGLACAPCNRLIGFAGDDPDRLILIAANLRAAAGLVAKRIAEAE